MNEKEIITVVEAARILHISPQIVRAKCQKGFPQRKFPVAEIGCSIGKRLKKFCPDCVNKQSTCNFP